ncbi:EPIDERMAL PATTERNING FACTOR-like protein 5 [Triticum dicoccoides]|uniref:EPIDERMAL PATTERNING FACTOR-like protein 5 n=1 Tax=Triticum dicoccoides TaxID=85692 RepID=UPI000E78B1F8|nr:EPIDERMAL PATTERNING FACTOR-like protein 5 [Triticum dicoccoides]
MGWASRRGLALALLLHLLFLAAALGGCAATSRKSGSSGGKAALEQYSWGDPAEAARRRELVGPGSSPPTCRSRCGRCHPCRPVHVAIQPGVSFPLEYYPEAWRCKCGDRLFMP